MFVTPTSTVVPLSRFQLFVKRFKTQPHPRTLTDRQICKRIIDLFEYELAASNVRGIHFYVQDTVVSLQGTVHHAHDRQTLVRLVQQVPNVGYVVDHLKIRTEN